MMPRIPEQNRDLKRYVLLHDLRRGFIYLVWIVLWIGGALSYNNNHQTYPEYRRMTGWKMVLLIAIAVLSGFLLFRVWRYFTNRTRYGVIINVGLSRSYEPSSDSTGGSMDYDFRLNTKLHILDANGKRCTIRFEQKRGFYQYYYEGNRIIRFHGLPYPINLDPDATHGYVCAACGSWSETEHSHCEICGLSLIDPKNITLE